MNRFFNFTMLCCAIVFPSRLTGLAAQENRRQVLGYPPQMQQARAEVYKTIGDLKLKIYLFTPPDWQATDKRPAIVFFFGGGWRSGTPGQFEHHCEHLAARGMVAMAADYRVSSRHGTKAIECVRDAKSAVRWVRREATRLGIDPQRIAAGGGSAGGHLAACAGLIPGLDEPGEDPSISARPDALVLFNPAVVLSPIEGQSLGLADRVGELRERLGVEPRELSPFHHIQAGAPPTIIFHGKADTTVSYGSVEAFAAEMKRTGNRCELHGYEDQQHGFFNYGRAGNEYYLQTVRAMDQFLVSLAYLQEKRS